MALITLFGAVSFGPAASAQTAPSTTVTVGTNVKLAHVKRLGVNLGTQTFWDSGQMMRNLTFRNPGFEGELWQSILHCKAVTATTCTDDNSAAIWPANFFAGATGEFILGGATGVTAAVNGNAAASSSAGTGVVLQFATAPAGLTAGDYVVVRMHIAGNAMAGWWSYKSSAASISTELTDLSPETPGKQALRMTAVGVNQYVVLSSFFDSSYSILMHGGYTLSFRAKGLGGNNLMTLSVTRNPTGGTQKNVLFSKSVTLGTSWQDYSYSFQSKDIGGGGGVALSLSVLASSVLLDDVALTADAGPNNPTAFRDEVVSTLQALHPGVLRFMDAGTSFGSNLDNMIAPSFGRERTGFGPWSKESDDISMGLHDFLVLSQTIGAEPWYTFPAGSSTQDVANMMDYLGGSTSTVYGAKRAALGQAEPWTSVFPMIHLEFGNEVWNSGFAGANFLDATAYGKRATAIFGAARSSASYSSKHFDLIVDGWAAGPSWSKAVLAAASNYDTIDAAPYLFNSFNDASSTEAIFGSMFAQPEALDSVPTGLMAAQKVVASTAKAPANLAVYESSLSTNYGSATQAQVDATVPSVGAGLAATEHMLLMMRDLGITNQAMFTIAGASSPFRGTVAGAASSTQLWGMVIDMGGPTNRMRPIFLSEQLANSAILPTMLPTTQSGANPTWNQPLSTNDRIRLDGAHYIQSFAFTDGTQNSVILFNLHRTDAQTITFSGPSSPVGSATVTTLTAPAITASNEQSAAVAPATLSETFHAGTTISLPPYSMTVITSAVGAPSTITSVNASCGVSSLTAMASATCAAQVGGTGPFLPDVSWRADQGSVSSAGVYTAPASMPASGIAKITATSLQDGSRTATATIAIPSITSVSVQCGATTLVVGAATKCNASVQGHGAFSSDVAWSANGGSIDGNGNLAAPKTGTAVTVQAVSKQDTTKAASATIALTAPPVVDPYALSTPATAVASTFVVIRWSTLSPSVNAINYGLSSSFGTAATAVPWASTAASFTIKSLKPSTKYYFQLVSTFPGGVVRKSTLSLTTTAH